jgi:hypothetical protein
MALVLISTSLLLSINQSLMFIPPEFYRSIVGAKHPIHLKFKTDLLWMLRPYQVFESPEWQLFVGGYGKPPFKIQSTSAW